MISLRMYEAQFFYMVKMLEVMAELCHEFAEHIRKARPRCSNCGVYPPPNSHICEACGWDNLQNKEV